MDFKIIDYYSLSPFFIKYKYNLFYLSIIKYLWKKIKFTQNIGGYLNIFYQR